MNTRTAGHNCFSRNLKYLRSMFSINQQHVAGQVNKGQTTIANWENRVSEPSMDELLLLSNFFDIDIADLIKTDLEQSGLVTEQMVTRFRQKLGGSVTAGPQQGERKRGGYNNKKWQDSLVQEESEISAWIVLRMLRTIEGKIDGLRELVEKKSHRGK